MSGWSRKFGGIMRLYSADISPFAARVRIALRYKGLAYEDAGMPSQGLKSTEYLGLNPMGKIPLLVLADGTGIPESETILEYLEDQFPTPSLRPADPVARARMRTIIRVTENYLTPPTARLFPHLDPTTRDTATVAREIGRVQEGLGYLARYLSGGSYAYGTSLTLADCCLFPSLLLCQIVGSQLGFADLLAKPQAVADYYSKAASVPPLAAVREEITRALSAHQH
jgi:glutathione S-transferase